MKTQRKRKEPVKRASKTQALWIDPVVMQQVKLYKTLTKSPSEGQVGSEILRAHFAEVLPKLLQEAALKNAA